MPSTAATTDPARIPIVACSCSASSSKASPAMNSEIVNPMPARVAPAMRCDQRTPPGSTPQPVRSATAAPTVIPIALPTTSATATPMVTDDVAAARSVSASRLTPALARPKTGTTA